MDLGNFERRHFRFQINADKFRRYLSEELHSRLQKNPRYSLRAFAQQLEINQGTLSQLLAGKRPVTPKTFDHIVKKLRLSGDEIGSFTDSHHVHFKAIDPDVFGLMADWYHYAILESTFIKDFDVRPASVADALGISVADACAAIDRLERLNLLQMVNGRYRKTQAFITNLSSVSTSAAHKELQRQITAKARDAIDDIPQEEKDITSLTLSIDEDRLSEACQLIKEFRRSFDVIMGEKNATRVYNLSIQLVPVSKSLKNSSFIIKDVV